MRGLLGLGRLALRLPLRWCSRLRASLEQIRDSRDFDAWRRVCENAGSYAFRH